MSETHVVGRRRALKVLGGPVKDTHLMLRYRNSHEICRKVLQIFAIGTPATVVLNRVPRATCATARGRRPRRGARCSGAGSAPSPKTMSAHFGDIALPNRRRPNRGRRIS